MNPSLTSTLVALGARGVLVGVEEHSDSRLHPGARRPAGGGGAVQSERRGRRRARARPRGAGAERTAARLSRAARSPRRRGARAAQHLGCGDRRVDRDCSVHGSVAMRRPEIAASTSFAAAFAEVAVASAAARAAVPDRRRAAARSALRRRRRAASWTKCSRPRARGISRRSGRSRILASAVEWLIAAGAGTDPGRVRRSGSRPPSTGNAGRRFPLLRAGARWRLPLASATFPGPYIDRALRALARAGPRCRSLQQSKPGLDHEGPDT